jgi:hypothetical protein
VASGIGLVNEGPVASIHVCDFSSALRSLRWAARASRTLASTPGARFAKVMRCLGTRGSAGFSPAGVPHLRRLITLLIWDEQAALDAFLAQAPLARAFADCRWAWHIHATALQSRGTFAGVSPLADIPRSAAAGAATDTGPIAALTLGRTSWRSTPAFTRITPCAERFLCTEGLITAVSAGLPVRGNCTFTLWESEAAMRRFAYGQEPGEHRETIRQNKERSVLLEQLSARFRPTRIEGSWDPEATPNAAKLQRLASALAST